MTEFLVFADSHGYVRDMAAVILENERIDNIIFLGDGVRAVKSLREEFTKKKFTLILGNNDAGEQNEYDAANFVILNVENAKIGLCHGHLFKVKTSIFDLTAHGERAGLSAVLFGHTHIQKLERTKSGMLILNPGSIMGDAYAILTVDGSNVDAGLYKR